MGNALAYHRATKYAPETIDQHPGLDWARQPPAFKSWDDDAAIELGEHLPIDPNPFCEHGSDGLDDGALGLGAISRWLYFTYGVTGIVPHQPRPLYLRAAPSAGGLYPAECALLVRSGRLGLEPGLYGFDPVHHRIVPLWTGEGPEQALDRACYGNAAVAAAPLALIVSGVFARSAWRYRDRGYRRVLLDSGHVLGNAGLAAAAIGLRSHVTAAFCDAQLATLLRVPLDQEGPLAVVAANLPGAAERPAWSVLPSATGDEDATPLALHLAGALPPERPRLVPRGEEENDVLATRYGERGGEALAPVGTVPLAGQVLETILRRRSTRAYRRAAISREQLARILASAYLPEACGLGEQPALARSQLLTFVAIADVAGIEPGLYYLAPHRLELRQLRAGCDREAVRFLCLGQDLGGDAAATVFHTVDLPRAVTRLGERAYRIAHLDAGMLGQRLNLAALAEGLGASGIGGFFDDHVNRLLGVPTEQAVVYITTLGTPHDAA